MIKIKIQSSKYNRVLFCSDLHYFHSRDFLYKPRGFDSAEKHSEFIRREIQSLHPEDVVFFLGDFALNCPLEKSRELLEMFPCKTFMIAGNHNSGVRQAYEDALEERGIPKGVEYAPIRIAENVTYLGECFELDVDQHRFFCRHFASLLWDGINKGPNYRMALVGHSHGNFKELNPGQDGFGKILDVGVDNALKYNGTAFFTLEQVVKILNQKKNAGYDHHS